MPALKDIGSFRINLANTALAKSPLWNMPAETIVPAQLAAFKARLKLEGFEKTDLLFRSIIEALGKAEKSGEIRNAPILNYSEPEVFVMTSRVLREGFESMTRPTPAAILFALEVGLEPEQVVTLTWEKARMLVNANKIKPYARRILDSQVRHITSGYVFWKTRKDNKAEPLFGLELEVFEAFGMIWSELRTAYEGMILNDDV